MPCIRGLRIPVATVVAVVADGLTFAEMRFRLDENLSPKLVEPLGRAGRMLFTSTSSDASASDGVVIDAASTDDRILSSADNLLAVEADLETGAIVVLGNSTLRIRRLPMSTRAATGTAPVRCDVIEPDTSVPGGFEGFPVPARPYFLVEVAQRCTAEPEREDAGQEGHLVTAPPAPSPSPRRPGMSPGCRMEAAPAGPAPSVVS